MLPDIEIALEVTANSDVVATLLPALLFNVAGSNSRMTRGMAEAAVHTDKIGAWVLARLLVAGFWPSTWVADRWSSMRSTLSLRYAELIGCDSRTHADVSGRLFAARNRAQMCPPADLFYGVDRRLLDIRT